MKRPVRIEGITAYVTLTKGYTAVIDAADAPDVGQWNWIAHEQRRADGTVRAVYAARGTREGPLLYLHRALLGTPGDVQIDHEDGDGLNCRRANLRPATHGQNMHNQRTSRRNTSGVKGVVWLKRERLWRARVNAGGREAFNGYFATFEDAASAVAQARRDLHGDFARHA